MKKINKILALLLLAVSPIIFSCERDLETEGISIVTELPSITLNGARFVSVPVGGTYTDPGASGKAGTETATVTTTGDVNFNKPGVYRLKYTATNKDGVEVSESRYVGVIAPDAVSADLSGEYERNAGAFGIATVTKVGPGLYTNDNIGGIAEPDPMETIYFYNPIGTQLVVPSQVIEYGDTYRAVDASYTFGPPSSFTWTVIAPGYGTAPRTFIKQ